jgi:YesN/AraC family two-component response regulator
MNNSIEDIFKLGFDSYLPKPFNKYELESLLERYLPIQSHTETKEEQNKEENVLSSREDDLEEFLAIYGDSDRLIERYIKENRDEQTKSVLSDLKKVSRKIGAYKFIKSINAIERQIEQNSKIDNNTVYTLSKNLKELKTSIIERLNER